MGRNINDLMRRAEKTQSNIQKEKKQDARRKREDAKPKTWTVVKEFVEGVITVQVSRRRDLYNLRILQKKYDRLVPHIDVQELENVVRALAKAQTHVMGATMISYMVEAALEDG